MINTLLLAIDNFGALYTTQSVLVLLMAILGIAMIVTVLMQKSSSQGIGAISGDTDTYYGKNKKQNKDKVLKIVTVVLGAIMMVVSIIYFVLLAFTL